MSTLEPVADAVDERVRLGVEAAGVERDHARAVDDLRQQVEDHDALGGERRHERQPVPPDARERGGERRPRVHRLERLGHVRDADAGEEREPAMVDADRGGRHAHAGTSADGAGAAGGRRRRRGPQVANRGVRVLELGDPGPGHEVAERLAGRPLVAVPLQHGAEQLGQVRALHALGDRGREAGPGGVAAEPHLVPVDRVAHEPDLRDVGPGAAVGAAGHPHRGQRVVEAQPVQLRLELVRHRPDHPLRLGHREAAGREGGAGHRDPRQAAQRGAGLDAVVGEDRGHGAPPRRRHVDEVQVLVGGDAVRRCLRSRSPGARRRSRTPGSSPSRIRPFATRRPRNQRAVALLVPAELVVAAVPVDLADGLERDARTPARPRPGTSRCRARRSCT